MVVWKGPTKIIKFNYVTWWLLWDNQSISSRVLPKCCLNTAIHGASTLRGSLFHSVNLPERSLPVQLTDGQFVWKDAVRNVVRNPPNSLEDFSFMNPSFSFWDTTHTLEYKVILKRNTLTTKSHLKYNTKTSLNAGYMEKYLGEESTASAPC